VAPPSRIPPCLLPRFDFSRSVRYTGAMADDLSRAIEVTDPGGKQPRSRSRTERPANASQRKRKWVLSPTRICTYLECPRKYRYIYIDKLPRYFGARAYFSFGSSLHRALQEYHEAGGAQTQNAEALISRLEQNWIGAGYESAEDERARLLQGREILAAYHESAATQEGVTLYTEKLLRIDMGDYALTGRIDRLDSLPDGGLEVIDYKSGERLPTSEEVADDLPLAIYQLLCVRTFECPRVKASIYHLRTGSKVSTVRTAQEVEPVAEGIHALYARMRAEERYDPIVGDHCSHCDFLDRCRRQGWDSSRL